MYLTVTSGLAKRTWRLRRRRWTCRVHQSTSSPLSEEQSSRRPQPAPLPLSSGSCWAGGTDRHSLPEAALQGLPSPRELMLLLTELMLLLAELMLLLAELMLLLGAVGLSLCASAGGMNHSMAAGLLPSPISRNMALPRFLPLTLSLLATLSMPALRPCGGSLPPSSPSSTGTSHWAGLQPPCILGHRGSHASSRLCCCSESACEVWESLG
ncbi:uncharacterized protein LOC141727190 [Zonotrichia albicollis]|uniref:uncharacterized protein LOC141727190 n=1 Tax=Zonotrichia albicollis TaxID=44394 RepID=UPI003D80E061